jgi:hypothetical protein
MTSQDKNLAWSLLFALIGLCVALWVDKATGLAEFSGCIGWAARSMFGDTEKT